VSGTLAAAGLAEVQALMRAWSTRTGCGQDPLRQMLCLAEEVGEAACEVRRLAGFSRRPDDGTALSNLAAELADVVITAVTTANIYGIDLTTAVARKAAVVDARDPHSPPAHATRGGAAR
jgi:NTP pyrophosphatase (non-canonical NTP hydrolase)